MATHSSTLGNPMDRGAWWAAVHGVPKSRIWLSVFTFNFHFLLSCIGGGDGNPLQGSCLENPRDGGTWWAAVSGVPQSRTWLKQLSSSSKHLLRTVEPKENEYNIFLMYLIEVDDWYLRRRQWQPTPVLLPGRSHGQRSPVGCRLWGRTESDTTEVT